jgi:hypothetical protein
MPWKRLGIAPPFFTSVLDGCEGSASRPGRFTPGERAPGIHRIGGSPDPRAGLVIVGKRKSIAPARNRIPALQPVARRCTDWATRLVLTRSVQSLIVLCQPRACKACIQILFRNPKGKMPLVRPRRREGRIIRMWISHTWENVWVRFIQLGIRASGWLLCSRKWTFRLQGGNLLSSWVPFSFSRRILNMEFIVSTK